jgi:hypothetical protein
MLSPPAIRTVSKASDSSVARSTGTVIPIDERTAFPSADTMLSR